MHIYGNRDDVDLCLQGSGNLHNIMWRPNGPEYCSNFSASWQSFAAFDVLSAFGVNCHLTDMVIFLCLLLQRFAKYCTSMKTNMVCTLL